jgi:hypothetical protein
MVHGVFPEPHGAREDTTRCTITPELAAMVAYGTIAHLEHARRAPSAVVTRNIIRAYQPTEAEAEMLLAEAVEGAGQDSPYKEAERRSRSSRRRVAPGAFYGARGY